MDEAGVKKTSTLLQLKVSAEMTLSSHLQLPHQNLLKFAIFAFPANFLLQCFSFPWPSFNLRLSFSNVKCPPLLINHFHLVPASVVTHVNRFHLWHSMFVSVYSWPIMTMKNGSWVMVHISALVQSEIPLDVFHFKGFRDSSWSQRLSALHATSWLIPESVISETARTIRSHMQLLETIILESQVEGWERIRGGVRLRSRLSAGRGSNQKVHFKAKTGIFFIISYKLGANHVKSYKKLDRKAQNLKITSFTMGSGPK